MAGKSVSFNAQSSITESQLEELAKWLSCNGEVWGVGPTAVFASAAALFLYHELEATVFIAGDHPNVSVMEKTLISTMVLGMLALMIHLWVCSMRFFQYYLDTLIRDSPNVLLEMTTAGLLGGKATEFAALGPLTRFLRQQQPQIHITICWFLSLCYADYVRKNYCNRFNMPYLDQWQSELHGRASQGVNHAIQKVNSFVGSFQQRLRACTGQPASLTSDANTFDLIHDLGMLLSTRVRARHQRRMLAGPRARSHGGVRGAGEAANLAYPKEGRSCVSASSANQVKQLLTRLRNSGPISPQHDVRAVVHRSPASAVLAIPLLQQRSLDDFPWRAIRPLPFD